MNTIETVPDSERRGLIGALPPRLRPFASLMRIDRPIGTWLLYWPCAWGVALAGVRGRWDLFLWLALGAFAMRSAGCVYNDIVDRDLDRSVERTRLRPLASGRVRLKAAWALTFGLCLIGLVVLIQLNRIAQLVALASLALVAAYPFMKRVTWWPQAWLGLVFSWGALVGWPAVTGSLDLPAVLLWLGSVAWVVGYDTLYAIQDVEDDALVGVKIERAPAGRQGAAGHRSFLCAGPGRMGRGLVGGEAGLAGAPGFGSRRHPPRRPGTASRPEGRGGGTGPVPIQPLVRAAGVRGDAGGGLEQVRLNA